MQPMLMYIEQLNFIIRDAEDLLPLLVSSVSAAVVQKVERDRKLIGLPQVKSCRGSVLSLGSMVVAPMPPTHGN